MRDAPEVICEKNGFAGIITLNRPKALNALSHEMVRGMSQALRDWHDDADIKCVVVKGAGEKAFCAGGDVRTLRALCLDGRRDEALAFWHDEYILNTQIKRFPKPYISLIGGIVMGGGVGVSAHGSHRVAGENYLFAMPEVGIGFFPDVGAAYPLSRLPSHFGTYLAMTGDRIRRDDALYLGLATHAVNSADFAVLEQRLAAGEDVEAVLKSLGAKAGPSKLEREADLIDNCFSAPTAPEILARIRKAADTSDFARHILTAFDGKSPTSISLVLEQMRHAAALDFDHVMQMDYRLSSRLCEPGQDFFEGVRAVLVDKDGKPAWCPPTLDAIDPAVIESYFAPLPTQEFKAP